ncbi:MAG: tetratricopeptide repeat protein [Patescibacteria group bacterium]
MREEQCKQIQNFLRTGDYSSAINFLMNIKQESQNNLDYLYYSAHIARKMGNLAQAEDFCKKAIALSPNSRDINFELGIIYQVKGDYKKAIEFLKKLVENNLKNVHWTDMVDTLNSLALTYKKAHDFENALKYYNLALETLAQKIYEDIKCNPIKEVEMDNTISTQGWMRLAVGIVVKNSAKDGITKVLVPDGETATKLLQQNPLVGVAFYDEDGKRYILPVYFSAFSNALKFDIFFSNIVNNIGTLYTESSDYKRASECYQEAIEFTPPGVKYDDPHIGLKSLNR